MIMTRTFVVGTASTRQECECQSLVSDMSVIRATSLTSQQSSVQPKNDWTLLRRRHATDHGIKTIAASDCCSLPVARRRQRPVSTKERAAEGYVRTCLKQEALLAQEWMPAFQLCRDKKCMALWATAERQRCSDSSGACPVTRTSFAHNETPNSDFHKVKAA